jgi:HEAT repeat protein
MMLGALADGVTRVSGFLEGADAISTMNVFRALGVRIDGPDNGIVTVHGVGIDGLRPPAGPLDCGNAGTAMRLLMGLLAGQRFESVLIGALNSDETGEIILGARGLGRIKSGEAVKPLIGLLSHKLLGIRREAARSLGDIGRPAATAPLLKAAKVEGDLDVKILMITAAGRAGDKKQAPAFEAMLKDSSESTRLASAQALCSLGSPKCAQFASKLFSSADRNERFQAVMLFEGSSSKVSSPQLLPMLKDPDDKIRARAARILVQGGDAPRLEWLVIESAKAKGEVRLVYEDELEKLRLTDEQRQAILKKAGLQ